MKNEMNMDMEKEFAGISRFTALVYSPDAEHTLAEQVYAAIEEQGVFVIYILHQKEVRYEQERMAVMSCICWTDNPFDGIDISECVKYAVERYGKARMEIFENEQKITFEYTGDEVINRRDCSPAEAATFWKHLMEEQNAACDSKSSDKVNVSAGEFKLPDEKNLFKKRIQGFLSEDGIINFEYEKDILPYMSQRMRDNDSCCMKYINLEGTEIGRVIDVLSLMNIPTTDRVYLTYEGDISLLDATDLVSCVRSIVGDDIDIRLAAIYNREIGSFNVSVYTCV